MCVTAQRWEHPLLNDTRCSPQQSPVSSCNIPANGTRGVAGGIRQTGWIREGHGVEGPGSPTTRPGASFFVMSLESHPTVFQLADAIQHTGTMLCDGSLVTLEVLSAPSLCWWVGNAGWFSPMVEANEQDLAAPSSALYVTPYMTKWQ